MSAAPLSNTFRSLIGLGGLFTAAKSFEDNPVLASRWLNRAGLHTARVTWAHRVAASRRARSAHLVSAEIARPSPAMDISSSAISSPIFRRCWPR